MDQKPTLILLKCIDMNFLKKPFKIPKSIGIPAVFDLNDIVDIPYINILYTHCVVDFFVDGFVFPVV